MPNTSILDQLSEYLTNNYPNDNPLWNRSDNNTLGTDWLVATPTAVWGTPYSEFKQPVAGSYPDFDLARCSPVTSLDSPGTTFCTTVQSTVNAVGAAPANLSVGQSNCLYEDLYETMVSAQTLLDITTLTQPTSSFLAAFRNAITFISTKPAAQRPAIRILYSNPWPNVGSPSPWPRQNAMQFLQDVVRDVAPGAAMQIYVAVASSSWTSWNHSKIVAADGTRALVGGHNMWGEHYLGQNPVFDVSMQLSGQAALHAHDYANFLWSWVPWIAPLFDGMQTPLRASYTFDGSSGKNRFGMSEPSASFYTQLRSKLQPSATGTASVISIGRRSQAAWPSLLVPFPAPYYLAASYVLPSQEPADAALLKLIDLAQTSIRMSLQALEDVLFGTRSRPLMNGLAAALQRGVTITVVLSNPGAIGGGLTQAVAPYPGPAPADVNTDMLQVLQGRGLTELQAKSVINERFKVASLRYSADDAYPGPTPIPNHAKTLIVDDAVFYIGSQNLYPADLNEFGYIVQDTAAAASYVASYWSPLWAQSKRTVSTDYSTAAQQSQQLEAMLFIMALRKNPRLNATWSNALAARQAGAPGSSASSDAQNAYKQDTAAILDSIIENAGFYTRSAVVAATFQLPFFGDQQVTPNAESDRFVQDIATNQTLMVAFLQTINQPSATVSQADGTLTSFLKAKNYNCTGGQVNASFDNLRNHALSFWVGYYRDGWVLADGGGYFQTCSASPAPSPTAGGRGTARVLTAEADTPPAAMPVAAPTITIYGNTKVALGKDIIISPSFGSGVLSWTANDGLLANATAGQLTFGQVTRGTSSDPFVGLECYGTITYPDTGTAPLNGTVSFYARRSTDAPPDVPPSVSTGSTTKQANYVGWIVGGIAVAAVIGGALYLGLRQRPLSELERRKKFDEKTDDIELEPLTGGNEPTDIGTLRAQLDSGLIDQAAFDTQAAKIRARQEQDDRANDDDFEEDRTTLTEEVEY